jgi:hypothetical protein
MLTLEDDVIRIELPEGKTQGELINLCAEEIKNLQEGFYGRDIKITGRLTTGMALYMGHALAHICKSVSIFDPKENTYFLCVKH